MKPARAFVLTTLLAAACGGPPAPWPKPPEAALDLKIDVPAHTLALLQPVTVQLDLWRRREIAVDFTPTVPADDFAAAVTRAPEVPFGDGFWQRTTLVLRPVRGPGELVLPPFVARASDGTVAASTPEQKFTVGSVLAGHDGAIEAPGEPFPAPAPIGWWLLGAAAAFLVPVAAALLFGRRRRLRHAAAVALPAHARALRELQRLHGAPRTTAAEIERFYVDVSDVLRRYLEERFGLRAPERTTGEFLRDLEQGDALAREHRGALERFLVQCDMVKFAAFVPTENGHLATWSIAEQFVERTRADRVAAAPIAAPTAAVGA